MRFTKDWGFNQCRIKRRKDDPLGKGDSRIAPGISPVRMIAIAWRLRWAIAFGLMILVSQPAIFSVPLPASDSSNLPVARVHTLPPSLAAWGDNNQGDYFNQIESTPLGYLVWSQFPLKIYVDSVTPENTAANQRFQEWTAAARKAIAEWNVYLPLQEVQTKDTADILILRSTPARKVQLNRDTGLYDIPRAVAAQTNYEFYLTPKPEAITPRMTMKVSPNFTGASLLGTIRHELGHALGIWGHSLKPDDALYFSQVSDPPSISPRDINTLKKIYQQPTKLGWKI
jgi:predicted Zn-dependent protease